MAAMAKDASSSLALIAPLAAMMADTPQIDEPTASRLRISNSSPRTTNSCAPYIRAPGKRVRSVNWRLGSALMISMFTVGPPLGLSAKVFPTTKGPSRRACSMSDCQVCHEFTSVHTRQTCSTRSPVAIAL